MTSDEVRHVTEVRVLAALSHPLRRRLMDVLKVQGPGTASSLAGVTGQAVGNISHHLRVLGDCGLVEEAPELARDRRERWWRPAHRSVRWTSTQFHDDPAESAIADAAESLTLEHRTQKARSWLAAPETEKQQWGTSAFTTDTWLHLSPDELRQLGTEMGELLDRWRDRPAGGQRQPVFVYVYGVPGQP
ncbi:ArsR/SmtB family transcription factor [Actinoplanes derwentensis]|uniref:DNA-binding transcriptional regulator, ArsR family n=1 Tax=Actinoplanes derwentensis TaxID=113562 RepID=A0A1H1WG52_9ACTN|nr:ArsR family transcriptional regulator [Actinoplanes derwentensis]GID87400.1 transcriptional regulator [Actinoplanes derwentensis]SDS95296.1 DNA-binding transcriptional regulator, ArsR family [Actinoplanes derwentensis]